MAHVLDASTQISHPKYLFFSKLISRKDLFKVKILCKVEVLPSYSLLSSSVYSSVIHNLKEF